MTSVENPSNFTVYDPMRIIDNDISVLQSSFLSPDAQVYINSTTAVVYSASDLLAGYIVRMNTGSGEGAITETLDTASNIIAAMKTKLQIERTSGPFENGTTFRCVFNNNTNFTITLGASTGVSMNDCFTIDAGVVCILNLVVTGQSTNDGETDAVYCVIAGACSAGGGGCIAPSAGTVTASTYNSFSPPLFGLFDQYHDVSWTDFPNAAAYTYYTNTFNNYMFMSTGPNTVRLWTQWQSLGLFDITIVGTNQCGSASGTATTDNPPCFLAGSPVALEDGSTKLIEDVQVGDKVIGAFGEVNEVLALHRPRLGHSKMFCVNGEHHSSDHHPHISPDKKFYTYEPSGLGEVYGHSHFVITGNNKIEKMKLHGLRAGRVQKLETGTYLKTIDGCRLVDTIEVYSLRPETQLYNLVVSGSHTYHVNGYAVTGWPSEDDFDYDAWVAK